MLLMRTTKSGICLQPKANLHHSYGYVMKFWPISISNTLPITLTKQISIVFFSLKNVDPYDQHNALWFLQLLHLIHHT